MRLFPVGIVHFPRVVGRPASVRTLPRCARLAILIATCIAIPAGTTMAEQLVLNLNPQSSSLSGLAFIPAPPG